MDDPRPDQQPAPGVSAERSRLALITALDEAVVRPVVERIVADAETRSKSLAVKADAHAFDLGARLTALQGAVRILDTTVRGDDDAPGLAPRFVSAAHQLQRTLVDLSSRAEASSGQVHALAAQHEDTRAALLAKGVELDGKVVSLGLAVATLQSQVEASSAELLARLDASVAALRASHDAQESRLTALSTDLSNARVRLNLLLGGVAGATILTLLSLLSDWSR